MKFPSLPAFTPFPSQMRVGTDICSIARIRRIVAKDHEAFARRVLTDRERSVHWKRLIVPDIVTPTTRSTRSVFEDRQQQVAQAEILFDGEGNYILNVMEWNAISEPSQSYKATSDLRYGLIEVSRSEG